MNPDAMAQSSEADELALNGGPKAKTKPYSLPNKYGEDELQLLREVIESGRLMGPGGKVAEFEELMQNAFGVRHVVMVNSGTSALNTALAAMGVEEGDEVITTPMTDIGTVAAILALHAIPVFADVDLSTRLISPESARQRITSRTKAIMTVHMAGLPCEMDAFMALSKETGVMILEDASQAHGGKYRGRYLGSIGHAGAFSMNESKHMSTGDGGFVTTNDGEIAQIARWYRDKSYQREKKFPRGQEPCPFFGLNFRPTNLQAAVAIAQYRKLAGVVRRRAAIVRRYYEELSDLKDLELPKICDGGEPAYWPLPARYVGTDTTRDRIAEALRAEGIPVSTGMSPANNILRTELVSKKSYYPRSDHVPAFWRDTRYDPDSCPNVDSLQATVLRLPVDHRYTDEDVTETIAGIRKVWRHLIGPSR